MSNFSSSPILGNSRSYSYDWASRTGPADDGSCGENVAVAVLTANNIPIIGAHPARGNLCGMDINNMPASDAINLSLAENMIDGKFIEVYTDSDGFAYFQEIYPSPIQADLDIRTCVPTSNIDQQVDLVIVRGYDKPPVRDFKEFEELDWQETDSLSLHVPSTICQGRHFITEAWRSYKDPVLESAYKDGLVNLYELEAFESLIGYVIDFDGPTDPDVKCSFSETTTKLVDIGFTGLSCCQSTLVCDETGGSNVLYTYAAYSLGNFEDTDIYGERWPLLNTVQGVYLYGSRILKLVDLSAFPGGYLKIIVEDKKKLVNLPGNNWHWTLSETSGATVHLYSSTYDGDTTREMIGNTSGRHAVVALSSQNTTPTDTGGTAAVFLNVNGALGMVVDKCIVAVSLDRPSATVHDSNGNALSLVNSLSVRYQPIVVTDEPVPIAYNFGGGARLVDHTLDLYDADPSTQQTSPTLVEGSLSWLQTQTSGRTVDISLPFADEDACVSLANVIYDMQNESITSYNLVCGPTSEPVLGATVPGFEGRINRITESYQDSSSYNINVNIGPTFIGARGWNNSIWQRKTDNVSREGIVTWAAGDGINYRIRVKGLGVFHAINKTLSAFVPGEKVKVTIHNMPQEK